MKCYIFIPAQNVEKMSKTMFNRFRGNHDEAKTTTIDTSNECVQQIEDPHFFKQVVNWDHRLRSNTCDLGYAVDYETPLQQISAIS